MNAIDFFIISNAGIGFAIFILAQAVVFRLISTALILKAIMQTAFFALLINGLITSLLWFRHPTLGHSMGWLDFCFVLLLVLGLYGLAVFVYVLCVFGPFETSIRMRLVRECDAAREAGLSTEQLLELYNAKEISKVRLERLIGAGDIKLLHGRYAIVQRRNMFFILDQGASYLRSWIDKK